MDAETEKLAQKHRMQLGLQLLKLAECATAIAIGICCWNALSSFLDVAAK